MTRVAASLLQLDIRAAFSFNALWPLYLAYAIWLAVVICRKYVKDGTPPSFPTPFWLHLVFLVPMLAYGIIRNLI